MKYSNRPSFLEIESRGRGWALLYIAVEISYVAGLLGGLGFACWFLVRWPADWLKQIITHQAVLRPWPFYVTGLLGSLLIGGCLFGLAVAVGRWLFRRLDIRAVD